MKSCDICEEPMEQETHHKIFHLSDNLEFSPIIYRRIDGFTNSIDVCPRCVIRLLKNLTEKSIINEDN